MWIDTESPIWEYDLCDNYHECSECDECYDLDEDELQQEELEGMKVCARRQDYIYPDYEACECFCKRK